MWNRELEDPEHRKRRIALIRKYQSEGKVLTHNQIDEFFENEQYKTPQEAIAVPESEEILASARSEASKIRAKATQETETLKGQAEEDRASAELQKEALSKYGKVAFSASLARKVAVLREKIDEDNETDIEIRVSIIKAKGKWQRPKFSIVDEKGVTT